jgi:hypothetical protein
MHRVRVARICLACFGLVDKGTLREPALNKADLFGAAVGIPHTLLPAVTRILQLRCEMQLCLYITFTPDKAIYLLMFCKTPVNTLSAPLSPA